VVIADRGDLPDVIRRLQPLGYHHEGDLGVPDREAFTTPAGAPPHHLYVCAVGTPALDGHLAFRDALRADPAAADAYGDLKRTLAARLSHDRVAYTEAKSAFVERVLADAAPARAGRRRGSDRAVTRPRAADWAAYAACALALLYAVPSFYWALGGTAGLDTVGGSIEELARRGDPAGVAVGIGAGILKVAGGLLALALVRPWGRVVPRRLLLGAAWAASVVLTGYGGLLVVVGTLVLAGVIGPAGPVDRTALRWHVLVWDLWFLVWGLLLGAAAWHAGREPRGSRRPGSADG
jgi:hypothetical protein